MGDTYAEHPFVTFTTLVKTLSDKDHQNLFSFYFDECINDPATSWDTAAPTPVPTPTPVLTAVSDPTGRLFIEDDEE